MLIAGGGVGGAEAALALRALAPEIDVEVLSPDPSFTVPPLAPLATLEPDTWIRRDLADLVEPHGVRVRRDALVSVDAVAGTVETREQGAVGFDRLILAVGCQADAAVSGALTFVPAVVPDVVAILDELRSRWVATLGVVVPEGVAWTLPAYEVALAAARAAPGALVTVVTAEHAPLAALGQSSSSHVKLVLARAGVQLMTGWAARSFADGVLALDPDGFLDFDRVIALPRPSPRFVPGVPTTDDGWIRVDRVGAVLGLDGVYAVGDMTDEPLKHGGLAAAQADAVATAVAASLGFDVDVEPYRAVLEAVLLDGPALAGRVRSELDHLAGPVLEWREAGPEPWRKLAARHLGAALAAGERGASRPD